VVLYASTDGFTPPEDAAAHDGGAPGDASSGDAAGASYRDLVLRDGPLAYWRFEEQTGPIAHDETGHGNDATYLGTFVFGVDGALGQGQGSAIRLDGKSAYARVEDPTKFAFAGRSPFSLETWVRPGPFSAFNHIFMKGTRNGTNGDPIDTYTLALMPTDGTGATPLEFDRTAKSGGSASLRSTSRLRDGQWAHVVVTYAGAGGADMATAYLDGEPVGTQVMPANLNATNVDLVLGAASGPEFPQFLGDLDEAAIYDHELTAAQVLAHFRVGTGVSP
jgi:hypothetical protein